MEANKAANGGQVNDSEQRPPAPIIHTRADSDTVLESMFAIALKPPGTEMPLQKPMRMRNLPASFWKPPTEGSKSPLCHSRENSHDSNSLADPYSPMPVNVGSPQPQNPGQQQPPPSHSASMSHHSRTHSAPPTLQQTLAVALPQQPQAPQAPVQHPAVHAHIHNRQGSFDVNNLGDSLGALPPGWESTKTPEGQVYYMNHLTKTTQWEDPRLQIMQQRKMEQQQQNPTWAQMQQNALGPLPSGWEQGETQEGEVYFINHHDKKTTWYDPRIPIDHQRVPHRVMPNGGGPRGGQPICHLPQRPSALNPRQEQRLLNLQKERHDIQMRQQEIIRLQNDLQHRQQLHKRSNSNSSEANMEAAQNMLMRHSLNDPQVSNDPFLNTAAAAAQQQQADLHNRQESADSGLGMGSSFNLGSIPEDISGMESMDTGDLDTTLTGDSTPTAGTNSISEDHLMTTLPVDLGDDVSHDIMETLLNNSRQPNNQGTNVETPLTWL